MAWVPVVDGERLVISIVSRLSIAPPLWRWSNWGNRSRAIVILGAVNEILRCAQDDRLRRAGFRPEDQVVAADESRLESVRYPSDTALRPSMDTRILQCGRHFKLCF
jgi:hypothetical protein